MNRNLVKLVFACAFIIAGAILIVGFFRMSPNDELQSEVTSAKPAWSIDECIKGEFVGKGSARQYCITVACTEQEKARTSEYYYEIRFFDGDGNRIFLQENLADDEPEVCSIINMKGKSSDLEWKVTLDANDLNTLRNRNPRYSVSMGYIYRGKKVELTRASNMQID